MIRRLPLDTMPQGSRPTRERRHSGPCQPWRVGEWSVDTSDEMAGFDGRVGGRPRPGTTTLSGLQLVSRIASAFAVDPERRDAEQPVWRGQDGTDAARHCESTSDTSDAGH